MNKKRIGFYLLGLVMVATLACAASNTGIFSVLKATTITSGTVTTTGKAVFSSMTTGSIKTGTLNAGTITVNTLNGTALSSLVPYTGAISSINVGTYGYDGGTIGSHVNSSIGGQITITGYTDTTKQLQLGYDTNNNRGIIKAFWNGVPSNILLNPSGGNILIGTSTDDTIHTVQVNGTVISSGDIIGNGISIGTLNTGKVPYTGATGAVTLGSYGLTSYSLTTTGSSGIMASGGALQVSLNSTVGSQIVVSGYTDITKQLRLGYNTTSNYGDIQAIFNATPSPLTFNRQGGNILIGTTTDDTVNTVQANGSIKGTQFRLSAANAAPTSATATGTIGEIRQTNDYTFFCYSTNRWRRSAQMVTW